MSGLGVWLISDKHAFQVYSSCSLYPFFIHIVCCVFLPHPVKWKECLYCFHFLAIVKVPHRKSLPSIHKRCHKTQRGSSEESFPFLSNWQDRYMWHTEACPSLSLHSELKLDGRHRTFCLVNSTIQASKRTGYGGGKKILANPLNKTGYLGFGIVIMAEKIRMHCRDPIVGLWGRPTPLHSSCQRALLSVTGHSAWSGDQQFCHRSLQLVLLKPSSVCWAIMTPCESPCRRGQRGQL